MRYEVGWLWVVALALGGCGEGEQGESEVSGSVGELTCRGEGARFATDVVEVAYGPGQAFGRGAMPEVVLGPPHGGGCCQGSLDVVSLGNGGSIVVGFDHNGIVDGPGPDFVVFENPFEIDEDSVFAELGTVEVSDDGVDWVAFPCAASEPPYDRCAGHQPVERDGGDGPVDPALDGGDAFDLGEVGLERARLVRVVDREDLVGLDGVFDLDAVGIIHAACP
jgi:hypothetical protein